MNVPVYPDLADKVAVVTGGSKGIGAATCVLLGHNRARVAVCGRDEEDIERVTADTRDAGALDAAGFAADLTDPEGVARLRAEIEERLGPVEVLFAFAGGFGARTPLLQTQLEEWNGVVESNLTSTFLTLREFAAGIVADLTTQRGVAHVRKEVEDKLGHAEVLFAFAGGFGARTPLLRTQLEEWNAVVESNLTSTFLTLREFAPGMVERGSGSIVTMASNAARFLDIKLTASYAAAKAGIAMLSRHAALELGEHGVRVNVLAPATILSERVKANMPEDRLAEIAAMSPLGSIGVPEDPAMAALFLASDSARWMTGVTVDVAGGRIMM